MLSQPLCIHKCIYPIVPGRHYFFEVIYYLWLVTIFLSLLPLRSPSLEGRGIYLGLCILIFLLLFFGILINVGFCVNYPLLQEEASLMSVECSLIYEFNSKLLGVITMFI